MSAEQYQRTVNGLDKEIADLEEKKAIADKKAADESARAARVTISKTASPATIRSKMSEIQRHEEAARKASNESADLQKKIADKRSKRNDAYLRLQREEQNERKKETKAQERMISNLQQKYEKRIAELERAAIPVNTGFESNDDASPEYDVFISHAWEDKESFVDEFVQALRNRGVKVWYDTTQIKWGDSMRKRIDDGLRLSRFGVAILSPNYIADGKYWTKAELDGLFQLESINGKKLLPIWHNLTKKQVAEFSPIIAGRRAMSTAILTPNEIADELKKLLPETRVEDVESAVVAENNSDCNSDNY